MGLRIDPNKIILTGENNELKFTTERRMPHIIGNAAGQIAHTVSIEDGYALAETNEIVASNPILASGDVFSLNFIKIQGSTGDTGNKYITANGSLTATLYNNTNGDFKGSTIITTGPRGKGNSGVVINIRTAVYGWDGSVGAGTSYSFTIYYRIFYGRFQ